MTIKEVLDKFWMDARRNNFARNKITDQALNQIAEVVEGMKKYDDPNILDKEVMKYNRIVSDIAKEIRGGV